MIAIKSNKNLKFTPSGEGIVEMRIEWYINYSDEGRYMLKLVDTCYVIDGTGKKILQEKPLERFKPMSYAELDELAVALNVDLSDNTKLRENLNELFRQGLLITTQKECMEGEVRYFSEAQDWEIVR